MTDTDRPAPIRRSGREPVTSVDADELSGWLETAFLCVHPRTHVAYWLLPNGPHVARARQWMWASLEHA